MTATATAALGLSGKVVAITGASKGWGRGCALEFSRCGARVVLNARDPSTLDEVVRVVTSRGGEAVAVPASVAQPDGAQAVVDAAVQRWGRLDVMVNNAGGIHSAPLLDMTEEQWRSVIAVQLDGVFYGARAAARQMVAQGDGGRIINMAGAGGVRGMHGNANHAASKGGVLAATFSWAMELADQGITVNAVRAAVVSATSRPLLASVRDRMRRDGRTPPDDDRGLGFYGPQEAAALVVWLASAGAASITGQFFGIDGPKVTMWTRAEPRHDLFHAPVWTPESLAHEGEPVLAPLARPSRGVSEVVPGLTELTPGLQVVPRQSPGATNHGA